MITIYRKGTDRPVCSLEKRDMENKAGAGALTQLRGVLSSLCKDAL